MAGSPRHKDRTPRHKASNSSTHCRDTLTRSLVSPKPSRYLVQEEAREGMHLDLVVIPAALLVVILEQGKDPPRHQRPDKLHRTTTREGSPQHRRIRLGLRRRHTHPLMRRLPALPHRSRDRLRRSQVRPHRTPRQHPAMQDILHPTPPPIPPRLLRSQEVRPHSLADRLPPSLVGRHHLSREQARRSQVALGGNTVMVVMGHIKVATRLPLGPRQVDQASQVLPPGSQVQILTMHRPLLPTSRAGLDHIKEGRVEDGSFCLCKEGKNILLL